MLPVREAFMPYLAHAPDTITLKTTTDYNWDIKLKNVNGKAYLDQGWPAFAIAHNLKIGTSSLSRSSLPRYTKWSSSTTLVLRWRRGALSILKQWRGSSIQSELMLSYCSLPMSWLVRYRWSSWTWTVVLSCRELELSLLSCLCYSSDSMLSL
jgi:hypothetical protein